MSDEVRGRGRGGRHGRGGGRGRGQYRQGGYRGGNQNSRPYNKRFHNDHNHHHSNDRKRQKFEVAPRLKESDVGVTEFIGSHERFSGVFKERYTDFQVHEISLDGEICKLTSQEIPVDPETDDIDTLKTKIPKDALEKIELVTKDNSEVNEVEIDVTNMAKDMRKDIHTIAKKTPSMLSQTVEKGEQKLIIISKNNKKNSNGKRFNRDNRADWSNRPGQYCKFLLHKVNMDTMDALNQLGSKLRIKPNYFHYAGTKDRRARTTQWICLKRVDPREIHKACEWIRGLYVGNFSYTTEPLKLGMLRGNHFKIALRNITANDDIINAAMTSLRDNGFINYYGLQRFGTIAEVPTHEIGKALLQGNWSEAINLILKPRTFSGEDENMTEARKIYADTKDALSALKYLKRQDKIEGKLLEGIVKCGDNNLQGALDGLPRNIRTMYVHAYQSFVWNNIVSRRIREIGTKPVVGDLVYDKIDAQESETLDYTEEKEEEEEEGKKELSEEKKKKSEEKMEVEEDDDDDRRLPEVKVLTEEDLPNYKFSDIVMPQPGWRVTYPTYAKPWFEEFVEKDGLSLELRQKNQRFSVGGAYRKILQVPKDMSWKIMGYNELHDDLIPCDMDELRGHKLPEDVPDGKYKALVIELSLGSSSYATMALREILMHDTSSQTQAEQSAAYHAKDAEEKEGASGEIEEKEVGKEGEGKEETIDDKEKKESEEKIDNSVVGEIEEKGGEDDGKIKEGGVKAGTDSPDVEVTQEKLQGVKMEETTESTVDAAEK